MNINTIMSAAKFGLYRGGLLLSKHSPEILVTLGIAGTVASTVMACKATLKVEALLKESEEKVAEVKQGLETLDRETYSEEDSMRDLTQVYAERVADLIKLYGPALLVGSISIACIASSHYILAKRGTALLAAYNLLSESYKQYRKNVELTHGKEVDQEHLFHKLTTKTVEGANGEDTEIVTAVSEGAYNFIFDDRYLTYKPYTTDNMLFLRSQQNTANDMLFTRGHVFLNEVFDLLGMPRTDYGQCVGWVNNREGDSYIGYIDFGIYDPNANPRLGNEMIEGNKSWTSGIGLNFNVDGPILDLI